MNLKFVLYFFLHFKKSHCMSIYICFGLQGGEEGGVNLHHTNHTNIISSLERLFYYIVSSLGALSAVYSLFLDIDKILQVQSVCIDLALNASLYRDNTNRERKDVEILNLR